MKRFLNTKIVESLSLCIFFHFVLSSFIKNGFVHIYRDKKKQNERKQGEMQITDNFVPKIKF